MLSSSVDSDNRPLAPRTWCKNRKQWLTNWDISKYLKVLERKRRGFRYAGTVTVDFTEKNARDTCISEYCRSHSFRDLFKRRCLNAIVVNTDLHTGPGKHWTLLLIDSTTPRHPRVFFYDSTGRPAPRMWFDNGTWVSIYKAAAASRGTRAARKMLETASYNTRRHQRYNTECGMFVLMACHRLACTGVAFEDFCMEDLDDREAHALREKFFKLECP